MMKMDAFKGDNARFLPKRTYTDKLSLGSGKDRVDLYYFGAGHTSGDTFVVYPALREANELADADNLESEHGYIKTFLFELSEMGPSSPNWLEKVREFRKLISEHAHMEEEQIFPRFKREMTEEQNAHITSLVNRDGFWMA